MRKKKTIQPKNKHQKHKPEMKWQTGEYERFTEYKLHLPYQFLLLCKLTGVTPRQVLLDFLDNLDCGSWKREGRDQAKEKLIEYFLEMGYGNEYYNPDEIKEIFREINAVGMLFPTNGKMKMIDLHAKWRNKYQNYWFKKWFRKIRRKV
jgi:hypothetical protein